MNHMYNISHSVGFLPGRKVFLPHEGDKQGGGGISAGEKRQNLLKPDYIVLIHYNIDVNTCTLPPTTHKEYIILFLCCVKHN